MVEFERGFLEAAFCSMEIVGADAIRDCETRPSNEGKYTSYRYRVRIQNITQLDDVYRQIGAIEGTRSVM